MARWSLTIRNGPRVERAQFDSLPAALQALQTRLDELMPQARRDAIEVLRRRYDAARQVAVRGEIAGPRGVRGGIDLRGDGSSEAYVGRWRRSLIDLEPDESAVDGLARTLSARTE